MFFRLDDHRAQPNPPLDHSSQKAAR